MNQILQYFSCGYFNYFLKQILNNINIKYVERFVNVAWFKKKKKLKSSEINNIKETIRCFM